jgi:hypothetical protein
MHIGNGYLVVPQSAAIWRFSAPPEISGRANHKYFLSPANEIFCPLIL